MNKIREAASYLKNKLQPDELDEKLAEAISEENWQASTQLLHEIANASYNYEKQQRIIAFIWDKFTNKSWKKVLKTLHLVDFLLKYGPTSLIESLKENVYQFRKLDDFTLNESGLDRGEAIRKQAKNIVQLLSDDQILNEERAKAKQIKQRMASIIGSGAYYGNFSNFATDTKTAGGNGSNYGNINSQTYKYVPTNKGVSFGQTVVREMQEKKKQFKPIEIEKIVPPKPNLSTMNQRKPQKKAQQSKTSFNNLSLKLVKPPQKKHVQVKPQYSPAQKSNQPIKSPQKKSSNFDIMDLDLTEMAQKTPTITQNLSIDFLSGQTAIKPQDNNFKMFLQPGPSVPQNQLTNYQQQNLLTNNKQPLTNMFLPDKTPGGVYNGTSLSNQSGKLSQQSLYNTQPEGIQFLGSTPTSYNPTGQGQVQKGSISLNFSSDEKKVAQKKDANSLIDFSNFREELNSLTVNCMNGVRQKRRRAQLRTGTGDGHNDSHQIRLDS